MPEAYDFMLSAHQERGMHEMEQGSSLGVEDTGRREQSNPELIFREGDTEEMQDSHNSSGDSFNRQLLAGAPNFSVDEVEVFEVVRK